MAHKLGFFTQWMFGDWAERDAINKNADTLETIEAKVSDLRSTVARQAQEITRLRAMVMGLVEVRSSTDTARRSRRASHASNSITCAASEAIGRRAWCRLIQPTPTLCEP